VGDKDRAHERRLRRRQDEDRALEPWQRYRALDDTLDHLIEILDAGDHKARFALIILGALNTANFVVATRPEVLAGRPLANEGWIVAYIALYAVFSVWLFRQAIGALKPNVPAGWAVKEVRAAGVPGVRFMDTMLAADGEVYDQGWSQLTLRKLNREMTIMIRVSARMLAAKYVCLDRLFRGLEYLTLANVVFVVALLLYGRLR
jgi:hypothetical protein